MPGQHPKNKINMRGAHSWDEVVQAARHAEAVYLAETKRGATGLMRGYFRYVGDYSASAAPWVGLLPNDKYFSVLCGGLKLVLGVPIDRVRSHLCASPDIITDRCQEKRTTYDDSRRL